MKRISTCAVLLALGAACTSVSPIPNASTESHRGPLANLYAQAHPKPVHWEGPEDYTCSEPSDYIASDVTEISLERTSCFGYCAEYTLRLYSDGHATYEGRANMARVGTWEGTLPQGHFRVLADLFAHSGFFALKDIYYCIVTDNPSTFISAVRGGERKTIWHYAPRYTGQPLLNALENLVDETLELIQWHRVTKKAA